MGLLEEAEKYAVRKTKKRGILQPHVITETSPGQGIIVPVKWFMNPRQKFVHLSMACVYARVNGNGNFALLLDGYHKKVEKGDLDGYVHGALAEDPEALDCLFIHGLVNETRVLEMATYRRSNTGEILFDEWEPQPKDHAEGFIVELFDRSLAVDLKVAKMLLAMTPNDMFGHPTRLRYEVPADPDSV